MEHVCAKPGTQSVALSTFAGGMALALAVVMTNVRLVRKLYPY